MRFVSMAAGKEIKKDSSKSPVLAVNSPPHPPALQNSALRRSWVWIIWCRTQSGSPWAINKKADRICVHLYVHVYVYEHMSVRCQQQRQSSAGISAARLMAGEGSLFNKAGSSLISKSLEFWVSRSLGLNAVAQSTPPEETNQGAEWIMNSLVCRQVRRIGGGIVSGKCKSN